MKAVIFDLDGTLINSLPDIARCMNNALLRNGLPANEEWEYRYLTSNGAELLARRAVKGRLELLQSVYTDYTEDYSVNCYVESRIYAGILELLAALKARGMKIAVLSNKGDAEVQSVLQHYFPEMPFDIMRGHILGIPLKPDPASALDIARRLLLDPSEIWYIGDTPTDVQCARNARMPCIAAVWGFRTREELIEAGASRLASDPGEALKLLDRE